MIVLFRYVISTIVISMIICYPCRVDSASAAGRQLTRERDLRHWSSLTVYISLIRHCKHLLVVVYKSLSRGQRKRGRAAS